MLWLWSLSVDVTWRVNRSSLCVMGSLLTGTAAFWETCRLRLLPDVCLIGCSRWHLTWSMTQKLSKPSKSPLPQECRLRVWGAAAARALAGQGHHAAPAGGAVGRSQQPAIC